MHVQFESYAKRYPETLHELFDHFRATGKNLLLGSELWDGYQTFAADRLPPMEESPLADAIRKSQEASLSDTDF